MNELLSNHRINTLTCGIATELENRNRFPLHEIPRLIYTEETTVLSKDCKELYKIIQSKLAEEGFLNELIQSNEIPKYLITQSLPNVEDITMEVCIFLVQRKRKTIDQYVEHLKDLELCKNLELELNKHGLINIADSRIEMLNHGILYKNSILIYPHQFLRRYYGSNFVELPSLLKKFSSNGLKVSIRIDPFRKCKKEFYANGVEKDYQFGKPFSEELLMSKEGKTKRTVYFSRGIYCSSYDAKYTVFRTKMMNTDLREFMIEEYCPIIMYNGSKSPGVGERYCIQKFAHICYNQNEKAFNHLDGAVRVFEIEEYRDYFKTIENGNDVDEKIGQRHKLFLIEGKMETELVKDLLVEWFRYNPHIQEYFSGETLKPYFTYDEYNDWKNQRKKSS
jgi:hypothetical protein